MPKIILKYELTDDMQKIEVSEDAEILTAQVQFNKACLWVLNDLDKPQISRSIGCYPTGKKIIAHSILKKYIATLQFNYGETVVHIFELSFD
jgi:hypothetical protein